MSPLQEPIRVGIVLGSDSEEETGPSVDIRGVGARNLSSQPRAPPAQSRSTPQSLSNGWTIPLRAPPSLPWTLIHAAHSA